MNLEEVYKQIDAEAEAIAKKDTGYDPDRDEELGQYKPKLVDFQIRKRYYRRGACPYAEKLHEAEQLRERYEKALEWVRQYALNCQNNRTVPNPLVIYSTIDKALAPKTTTDDTVNG